MVNLGLFLYVLVFIASSSHPNSQNESYGQAKSCQAQVVLLTKVSSIIASLICTLGCQWAFVSLLNGPLFPVSRLGQQQEALDWNSSGWTSERFSVKPVLRFAAAPGYLAQPLDCDQRYWIQKRRIQFLPLLLWNCMMMLEVRWFPQRRTE